MWSVSSLGSLIHTHSPGLGGSLMERGEHPQVQCIDIGSTLQHKHTLGTRKHHPQLFLPPSFKLSYLSTSSSAIDPLHLLVPNCPCPSPIPLFLLLLLLLQLLQPFTSLILSNCSGHSLLSLILHRQLLWSFTSPSLHFPLILYLSPLLDNHSMSEQLPRKGPPREK